MNILFALAGYGFPGFGFDLRTVFREAGASSQGTQAGAWVPAKSDFFGRKASVRASQFQDMTAKTNWGMIVSGSDKRA